MDIISFYDENIKLLEVSDSTAPDTIFDLTIPSFIYVDINISDGFNDTVTLGTITVEEKHEMRIDLLFMDMYDIDPYLSDVYLGNIDVILAINNIDNPLNIKKGMVIRFPSLEQFNTLRIRPENDTFDKKNGTSIRDRLIVPNKSTRKDKSREKFKDSGYSLPPVVLRKPKKPVSIKNDGTSFTISAGGI